VSAVDLGRVKTLLSAERSGLGEVAMHGLARPEHALMLTACLGRRDNLTSQPIALATRLFAFAAPLCHAVVSLSMFWFSLFASKIV
jgi:hypothetical protein